MHSNRLWLFVATTALLSCSPDRDEAADPAARQAPNAEIAVETAKNAVVPPPAAEPAPGIAPLTPEGWGPLHIGMTLAEVAAAAGPDSDPEAVGGPEPESCDIFHPARAPEGLMVMIEDGRLARISLSAPTEVKTDRGFGPGDSAAAVEAAYGDVLKASAHEYQEAPAAYLTVWASGGREQPHVRSPGARGLRYEVDQGGTVDAVHAGGPAIQYVEGCL